MSMPKGSLLLGVLLIVMVTTSFNVITSNRLVSDVNSYNAVSEVSKIANNLTELETEMKQTHYSKGLYATVTGEVSITNPMYEYIGNITISDIDVESSLATPLFVKTDVGSKLTSHFDNFAWKYKPSMVDWDGSTHTISKKNVNNDLKLLILNENTLDMIYNLDYYSLLPTSLDGYSLNLGQNIGILIEVCDNGVLAYFILNSEIENYSIAEIFNIKAEPIAKISKLFLEEYIVIGGIENLYYGTLIELFSAQNVVKIAGTCFGSVLTRVNIPPTNYELPVGIESFEYEISDVSNMVIETFGSNFSISMEIKNLRK